MEEHLVVLHRVQHYVFFCLLFLQPVVPNGYKAAVVLTILGPTTSFLALIEPQGKGKNVP